LATRLDLKILAREGARWEWTAPVWKTRRMAWLTATYHVAAPRERVEARARALALEQSVECPLEAIGERRILDEIVAQVGGIEHVGSELFRVEIRLATQTLGGDTAQLLNMLFGNASLFDDVEFVDVALPDDVLAGFTGPRHGIEGIRALVGARERPLTNVALKPQGLGVPELAAMARTFALAGVDIIKDDHGIVDQGYSPFAERIPALQAAVEQAVATTGRPAFYAPNVSGTPRDMHLRATIARDAGCRVVLVAPMLVGLPAFRELVDDFPEFVYLAHPSFGGARRIAPPLLYGKLFRLFGADAVIFVNYGGRFAYEPETCAALAANLRAPWAHLRAALPVPAGGMLLERVDELLDFYGPDSMLLIGGNLLIARERLLERSREFVSAVERHEFRKTVSAAPA
jgi:ribulose-bisphosphate carboxylase large chain